MSIKDILRTGMKLLYPSNNGIYVANEDWDVLIILDACRWDYFKKYNNIPGKLEKRISRGTHTPSFLIENFKDKHFEDIVYVTANPFVNKLVPNAFHKIISVWQLGWNEKEGTVLPNTVSKYAMYAIKKYPNKRIIIHFMQPHYPYIGYNLRDNSLEELRQHKKGQKGLLLNLFPPAIYGAPIYRDYEIKLHKDGYTNNLKLVLKTVKDLISKINNKKIVITADHGEGFGEYIHPLVPIRVYGHIGGVRIPALTEVPWLIIDKREGA